MLLQRLQDVFQMLPHRDSVLYMLVDGSFVQNKANPADVDMVLVVEYKDDGHGLALARWSNQHRAQLKKQYHCDLYVADQGFVDEYWQGQFGKTRAGQRKGMLRIDGVPT